MRKQLYSVRDLKAESFGFPIPADNVGLVLRQWCDAVNSPDLPIINHPEDYALYRIGEFDTEKGVLIAEDQPIHVASAEEVLRHA